MVHFDPRANGNRSSGQFRLNRLRGRYLHHPDHRGRGKYGWQLWIEVGESPFVRDDFLDRSFQTYTRALFLRRHQEGSRVATSRTSRGSRKL